MCMLVWCTQNAPKQQQFHVAPADTQKRAIESYSLISLCNMVVVMQILLVLNLSYLPCFVQHVNKNYYCQANFIFYDLLRPLF